MLQTTSYSHLIVLIIAVAFLAAVIWAVVVTLKDKRLRVAEKALWAVVLVLVPVVGFGLWLFDRALKRRNTPRSST